MLGGGSYDQHLACSSICFLHIAHFFGFSFKSQAFSLLFVLTTPALRLSRPFLEGELYTSVNCI